MADGTGKHAKRARGSSMMPTIWWCRPAMPSAGGPISALFLSLLEAADDAADELEDAVFLLDLDTLQGKPLEALQTLAGSAGRSVAGMDQGAGPCGADRPRRRQLAETDDFLAAIDRVAASGT